ncbi:hypothetical protein ACVR1I_10335 [Streptococcus cameli]
MTNLLIIVGLVFAVIDPVGMLLLLGGLTSGFDKKKVFIYALGVFLGTSLLGTLLSAIFGKDLSRVIKSLSSNLFNMKIFYGCLFTYLLLFF